MANQFQDDFKEMWQNISQEVNNLNIGSYQLNLKNLDFNNLLSDLKNQFGITRSWWNNLNAEWKSVFRLALEMQPDATPDDNQLKQILQIQKLDCSEKQIGSLEPIKNLKFLQELDISSTNVVNLMPIRNLPNLLRLYCINTNISDLKPLVKLKNLRILHFSMTDVDNLSPLRYLVNLQEINFSETYVKNIRPLRKLKKLKMLSLKETKVSIRAIRRFQRAFPQVSLFYSEPEQRPRKRWWLF